MFAKQPFNKVHNICNLLCKHNTTISQVFEDNQACLKFASLAMPKLTTRSKHIAVKYHRLREKLKPMNITILPMKNEEQLADVFTKGLVKVILLLNEGLFADGNSR